MVKKFLTIFNKEISSLHEAAYLLAFFAFLSQLLALVRDKLLAHTFGASPILDIYYAAFRVPDLIFVSIASIVSASVLIPFFMEKMHADPEQGRHFINNVFSAFFFVSDFSRYIKFPLKHYPNSQEIPCLCIKSSGV